jgi:alkylation response protein AidB-like acyl-CoA dehydrogenase
MDFKLSMSQKDIQKAASDFAKGEFDKELAMEMDRNRTFPQELHQKASELGFIGIHRSRQQGNCGDPGSVFRWIIEWNC